MRTLTVPDPVAMRALAADVAARVRAGDLLVLAGDLGAGKTTFVQGLAASLGYTGPVVSPTFVLARVYRGGRLPVVHVDAYRLSSVDEVDDLDLDTDLDTAVTVVEWGAGLVDSLAPDRLEIHIARSPDPADEVRSVTLTPVGERWADYA